MMLLEAAEAAEAEGNFRMGKVQHFHLEYSRLQTEHTVPEEELEMVAEAVVEELVVETVDTAEFHLILEEEREQMDPEPISHLHLETDI
jgi:hypothetical protein